MIKLTTMAFRNLWRNSRRSLLTGGAVAFGLALMIWMINLQKGQHDDILRTAVATQAGHVVVQLEGYQDEKDPELAMPNSGEVAALLQQAYPDAKIVRRTQLGGLIISPTNTTATAIFGGVAEVETHIQDVDDKIVAGEWLDAANTRGLVIGAGMAESLKVEVGDKLVFMGQFGGDEVESYLFRVQGIFKTGSAEMDGFMAYANLEATQALLPMEDAAHQVSVHFDSEHGSEKLTPLAEQALASRSDVEVYHWKKALPDIWAFTVLDKQGADVMLAVLGVMVAMGVLNTMLMSVMERTREFGVLMSIGMKPWRLAVMVIIESVVLGLIGSIIGFVAGIAITYPFVVWGLDYTGILGETYEAGGVVVSAMMYASFHWEKMIAYSFAAGLFAVLSAIYPAWRVTRLKPVEAMRHH